MKAIDAYVTTKITFYVPDNWEYDDVEEEFINKLELTPVLKPKKGWNAFLMYDTKLIEISESSPYR